MSDIAIRVEQLGKRYRIGALQKKGAQVGGLRGLLSASFSYLAQTLREPTEEETLWALRDVSFEVRHGEVLGVIGRNGAGKSTLLKLLSRITTPTQGTAKIYGRVASMLEVGTGFHPDLTGRENIYINGAMMGMKRAEINRKFDEIVDFSGIEKFLDTPAKYYSSGMYVRLAFAVSAHLDPEIVIVDEVLAVGDVEFQQKCLGKMGAIAGSGRTVLFVSHNMSSIVTLCKRCLLMENGRVIMDDETHPVVTHYLSSGNYRAEVIKPAEGSRGKLSIERATLLKDGELAYTFNNSETLHLQMELTVREPIKGAQVAFDFYNEMEECIFSSTQQDYDMKKLEIKPGNYVFDCPIKLSIFREGRYRIKISSSVPAVEALDEVNLPLVFQLYDDSSPLTKLGQGRRGVIIPMLKWNIKNAD